MQLVTWVRTAVQAGRLTTNNGDGNILPLIEPISKIDLFDSFCSMKLINGSVRLVEHILYITPHGGIAKTH